jgi:hypothetical protein
MFDVPRALERGGRIAPGVEGLSVFYQVTEFDDISGQIESINGLSYSLLRPYMCSGGQIEIDTELNARVEDARQRKAGDDKRRRFEATWRHPRPGEFAVEGGHRKLALVAPTLSFRNIEFHWRTSKLYCRGSSPAFVMLMTVDSVFSGKCCRAYEAIGGRGNESIAAEEYAAAFLLTRWIQQNLQTDLGSINPLFVWDAGKPAGCCCNNGYREPGVIQTTWVDDTRFAALVNFRRIPEVSTFLETAGYRLIEQRERQKRTRR